MPMFTATQKAEILARISAFNMSGFTVKMLGNVCYYYQSFVGRDFKAWSQFAIFILGPYLNDGQKEVLLNYSKVSSIRMHGIIVILILFYRCLPLHTATSTMNI